MERSWEGCGIMHSKEFENQYFQPIIDQLARYISTIIDEIEHRRENGAKVSDTANEYADYIRPITIMLAQILSENKHDYDLSKLSSMIAPLEDE
jgi:hypothetical protein